MGENRGIRISIIALPYALHFVGSCPLHEAVRYFRYIYTLYWPKEGILLCTALREGMLTLYCPKGGHTHSVLP